MGTKLHPLAYRELWEKAAEVEIGLAISVEPDDQQKLLNALYACREELGGFGEFIICSPEPRGQVWIVRKSVELPE